MLFLFVRTVFTKQLSGPQGIGHGDELVHITATTAHLDEDFRVSKVTEFKAPIFLGGAET
jgi:hypothetical protein